MALSTSDITIKPSDGWVLLAQDPQYIAIRNRDRKPWQLSILPALGNPDEGQILTFDVYTQDDGDMFVKDTPSVGVFYIRALTESPFGEGTQMGWIFDDTPLVLGVTVDSTLITVDTTSITCDSG